MRIAGAITIGMGDFDEIAIAAFAPGVRDSAAGGGPYFCAGWSAVVSTEVGHSLFEDGVKTFAVEPRGDPVDRERFEHKHTPE